MKYIVFFFFYLPIRDEAKPFGLGCLCTKTYIVIRIHLCTEKLHKNIYYAINVYTKYHKIFVFSQEKPPGYALNKKYILHLSINNSKCCTI